MKKIRKGEGQNDEVVKGIDIAREWFIKAQKFKLLIT